MCKTNTDILNDLMEADDNAAAVESEIPNWNGDVSSFPMDKVHLYIKLDRWNKDDFSMHRECIIRKFSPFLYKVFVAMRMFKSDDRNDLNTYQKAFAKINGYRFDTYEEKCYVAYMHAIQQFYEGGN